MPGPQFPPWLRTPELDYVAYVAKLWLSSHVRIIWTVSAAGGKDKLVSP
jgi:hypothetical protein